MQKNFHLHDNVHGMEKLGAMEFIQSMLIQCDHGIVKVFPNWTGAVAKFENLRAKGCFLVSAEMKDGKVVRVEVKSEKGGRFRLVEPRQQAYNNKMPEGWVHGKTRNSGEATLERDFKPGEVVSLTMAGDCAATAGVLSPISFDAPRREGAHARAVVEHGRYGQDGNRGAGGRPASRTAGADRAGTPRHAAGHVRLHARGGWRSVPGT